MKEEIKTWLEEVNNGCEEIAKRNYQYPDYYVFQSEISINPKLLIMGANPAGNKTYAEALKIKNIPRKSIEDLKYTSNQYIENPNWNISKPLLEMFSGNNAKEVLENSIIMNAVYFNSNNVSDLKEFKADKKDMVNFSMNKTKEFIYIINRPQTILFIGADAPKWLGIKFDSVKDQVLGTKDDKFFLVLKKEIESIPHYMIYHTSMNNSKFNTGENLKMKQEFFEKLFKL